MPLEGEYEPSSAQYVRDQVDLYERTDGREGNTLRDTGLPVVVYTMRGARSGKLRKVPLMRVEHDGRYALIASKGGAPDNPLWYENVRANPRISVQDGARVVDGVAREVTGTEYDEWWPRAVAAFPTYAEYQKKTDRKIPVFVLDPEEA